MSLNNKISRLEVKNAGAIQAMAEAERQKKLEALEEWRKKNCSRIAWDLFALLEGPKLEHPADYIKDDADDGPFADQNRVFVDSHLAYFAMLDRVLKYELDEEGYPDKSKMSTEERAFAICLEHLFGRTDTDDGWLLDSGIFHQTIAFGLGLAFHKGEMSVAEVVQRIDDHRGGPEWRQICDTNAAQEELDARLGIPSITEIPPPGRAWIDPG